MLRVQSARPASLVTVDENPEGDEEQKTPVEARRPSGADSGIITDDSPTSWNEITTSDIAPVSERMHAYMQHMERDEVEKTHRSQSVTPRTHQSLSHLERILGPPRSQSTEPVVTSSSTSGALLPPLPTARVAPSAPITVRRLRLVQSARFHFNAAWKAGPSPSPLPQLPQLSGNVFIDSPLPQLSGNMFIEDSPAPAHNPAVRRPLLSAKKPFAADVFSPRNLEAVPPPLDKKKPTFMRKMEPVTMQPGGAPFLPDSVASHSVAVQCSPTPWMRYYFTDDQQGLSNNYFFKHFDIAVQPPPDMDSSVDSRKMIVKDKSIPDWVAQEWQRLYYVSVPNKPSLNWPDIKLPTKTSVDITTGGIDLTSDDHSRERIDFEEFIDYVSKLQPRTANDAIPLTALRCGLLSYCAKQLQGAQTHYKRLFLEKEQEMKDQWLAMMENSIKGAGSSLEMDKAINQMQLDNPATGMFMNSVVTMRQLETVSEELSKKLHASEAELKVAQSTVLTLRAQGVVIRAEKTQLRTKLKAVSASLAASDSHSKTISAVNEELREEMAKLSDMAKLGKKANAYYDMLVTERKDFDRMKSAFKSRTTTFDKQQKENMHQMKTTLKMAKAKVQAYLRASKLASDCDLEAHKAELERVKKDSAHTENLLMQKWMAAKEKTIDTQEMLHSAQKDAQEASQLHILQIKAFAKRMSGKHREIADLLNARGALAGALSGVQGRKSGVDEELEKLVVDMSVLRKSFSISPKQSQQAPHQGEDGELQQLDRHHHPSPEDDDEVARLKDHEARQKLLTQFKVRLFDTLAQINSKQDADPDMVKNAEVCEKVLDQLASLEDQVAQELEQHRASTQEHVSRQEKLQQRMEEVAACLSMHDEEEQKLKQEVEVGSQVMGQTLSQVEEQDEEEEAQQRRLPRISSSAVALTEAMNETKRVEMGEHLADIIKSNLGSGGVGSGLEQSAEMVWLRRRVHKMKEDQNHMRELIKQESQVNQLQARTIRDLERVLKETRRQYQGPSARQEVATLEGNSNPLHSLLDLNDDLLALQDAEHLAAQDFKAQFTGLLNEVVNQNIMALSSSGGRATKPLLAMADELVQIASEDFANFNDIPFISLDEKIKKIVVKVKGGAAGEIQQDALNSISLLEGVLHDFENKKVQMKKDRAEADARVSQVVMKANIELSQKNLQTMKDYNLPMYQAYCSVQTLLRTLQAQQRVDSMKNKKMDLASEFALTGLSSSLDAPDKEDTYKRHKKKKKDKTMSHSTPAPKAPELKPSEEVTPSAQELKSSAGAKKRRSTNRNTRVRRVSTLSQACAQWGGSEATRIVEETPAESPDDKSPQMTKSTQPRDFADQVNMPVGKEKTLRKSSSLPMRSMTSEAQYEIQALSPIPDSSPSPVEVELSKRVSQSCHSSIETKEEEQQQEGGAVGVRSNPRLTEQYKDIDEMKKGVSSSSSEWMTDDESENSAPESGSLPGISERGTTESQDVVATDVASPSNARPPRISHTSKRSPRKSPRKLRDETKKKKGKVKRAKSGGTEINSNKKHIQFTQLEVTQQTLRSTNPVFAAAVVLKELEVIEQASLLGVMEGSQAARICEHLGEPEEYCEVLAAMTPKQAARIMRHLSLDHQERVLESLSSDQAAKVGSELAVGASLLALEQLPPTQQEAMVRQALQDNPSTGALMLANIGEESARRRIVERLSVEERRALLEVVGSGSLQREEVAMLLEVVPQEDMHSLLEVMDPSQYANTISHMSLDQSVAALASMTAHKQALVLQAMDPVLATHCVLSLGKDLQGDVLQNMKDGDVTSVLNSVTIEDAAQLLGELSVLGMVTQLQAMKSEEASQAFSLLTYEQQQEALKHLNSNDVASLLKDMDPVVAAKLLGSLDVSMQAEVVSHISQLAPETASAIIVGMDAAAASDVLRCVDSSVLAAMLAAVDPAQAGQLLSSLPPHIQAQALTSMTPLHSAHLLAGMASEMAAEVMKSMDTEILVHMLSSVDADVASKLLTTLPESIQAETLTSMSAENASQILQGMDASMAAEVMQAMGTETLAGILSSMDTQAASKLITSLPPDVQAKALTSMSVEHATAIMQGMEHEAAVEAMKCLDKEVLAQVLASMDTEAATLLFTALPSDLQTQALTSMTAHQASQLLQGLDKSVAVGLLSGLSPEECSLILSAVDPALGSELLSSLSPEALSALLPHMDTGLVAVLSSGMSEEARAALLTHLQETDPQAAERLAAAMQDAATLSLNLPDSKSKSMAQVLVADVFMKLEGSMGTPISNLEKSEIQNELALAVEKSPMLREKFGDALIKHGVKGGGSAGSPGTSSSLQQHVDEDTQNIANVLAGNVLPHIQSLLSSHSPTQAPSAEQLMLMQRELGSALGSAPEVKKVFGGLLLELAKADPELLSQLSSTPQHLSTSPAAPQDHQMTPPRKTYRTSNHSTSERLVFAALAEDSTLMKNLDNLQDLGSGKELVPELMEKLRQVDQTQTAVFHGLHSAQVALLSSSPTTSPGGEVEFPEGQQETLESLSTSSQELADTWESALSFTLEALADSLAKQGAAAAAAGGGANTASSFGLRMLTKEAIQRMKKQEDLESFLNALFAGFEAQYSLQCMLTELVYDDEYDDDKQDDPTTYDDNMFTVKVQSDGFPAQAVGGVNVEGAKAISVGQYLPRNIAQPQFSACNSATQVKIAAPGIGFSMIHPIEMDEDCPMLTCGACFGTLTCAGTSENLQAASHDLAILRPWLKEALTHIKNQENDSLRHLGEEKRVRRDSITSDSVEDNKALHMQNLTIKKVQLEKLLRTQLAGMLAELKRYSKTSPSVVAITSGVICLLGNQQLLEVLSEGLPKHENALKGVWDVARGAMNIGKKDKSQKDQKEGMIEAMARFVPTLAYPEFTLKIVRDIWGSLDAGKIRHCSKAAVVLYNWLTIVLDIFNGLAG